nr:hypothetical protein [uncultured Prevotella sp.]
MKKRFTLMMMVLCILMSIPLKMMAYDEITAVSHYKQNGKWTVNSNFIFTTNDGKIYTCELKDVPANETVYFRIVKNEKEWGPNSGSDLKLTSDYQPIYQVDNSTVSLKISPSTVQSTYTITYDSENNQIKYDAESGGTTGGGSTGPTVEWDTENNNRLKGRVYSQGFYLAGNFFSFSDKDNNNTKVTYDDAVFKFQQQKNDDKIEIGKVYEVYKVEIPASLTAHGQVMYVDEFGKIKNIFGPGSAYGISRTCPETDSYKGWLITTANVCDPITQENTNYWNFRSRNESASDYSDGMYNLYIAVDATTHEVKWWKIEHDSDRRVAYFISDASNATAMPIYDAYDKNVSYFSNKFWGSVNFAKDRSYYVISNYVLDQQLVSMTKDKGYETIKNDKNYLSTANKLFLQGNGGYIFSTSDQHNEFSPNEKPMPGDDLGTSVVEYQAKAGNFQSAEKVNHLGIRGQVSFHEGSKIIKSVSMVGDAIPGTLKEDGITWDYTSPAANMTYDDVEQCYTTTIVTTAGNGEKHFRFVGNHDPKINWYEDTTDDPKKKAKTPLTTEGHTADANDPNKVNYTQDGADSEEDWNIIWNRPAGRWTVRLYFYTYNVAGEPVTDYYYTINANNDLVLRDFGDVVYKTEGPRDILLRGGYRFFRTWSDDKAWKVSKDVDIFIVNGMKEGTESVEFSLKKIPDTGTAHVIPAGVGVILATKADEKTIDGGGKFYPRPSLTSYNTLVIPMEEYTGEETTADYKDNLLEKMVEAGVVPTYNKDKDEYNYLFGFFRANKGLNVTTFDNNKFLLGFWLSQGAGNFYSNSAYLPVSSATAAKMKLGTKYGQFEPNPATGKSMYIPALLFDFANVGGTTGINEVVNQSTKLNDGKYYTLSGQQVEKPTAGGIYIHNGRKFVVK